MSDTVRMTYREAVKQAIREALNIALLDLDNSRVSRTIRTYLAATRELDVLPHEGKEYKQAQTALEQMAIGLQVELQFRQRQIEREIVRDFGVSLGFSWRRTGNYSWNLPYYPMDVYPYLNDHVRAPDDYFQAGIIPICLGGDHSITLAELRVAARVHGPVALLQFDSHTDAYDVYHETERSNSGTMFRRAVEEGMPLYKYVGNRILTAFQNRLLGMDLSESGRRDEARQVTAEAVDRAGPLHVPLHVADGLQLIGRLVESEPVGKGLVVAHVEAECVPGARGPPSC